MSHASRWGTLWVAVAMAGCTEGVVEPEFSTAALQPAAVVEAGTVVIPAGFVHPELPCIGEEGLLEGEWRFRYHLVSAPSGNVLYVEQASDHDITFTGLESGHVWRMEHYVGPLTSKGGPGANSFQSHEIARFVSDTGPAFILQVYRVFVWGADNELKVQNFGLDCHLVGN